MARQPNMQDISGGLSRSTYYYLRELFVLFWPMQACMLPWWTQPPRPQDVGSLAKSAEPHSRILSFCKAPLVAGLRQQAAHTTSLAIYLAVLALSGSLCRR